MTAMIVLVWFDGRGGQGANQCPTQLIANIPLSSAWAARFCRRAVTPVRQVNPARIHAVLQLRRHGRKRQRDGHGP